MNMRRKSCVLLPAAGRKTQLFHLISTEPGVHLLVHPCMCQSGLVQHLDTDLDMRLKLIGAEV